MDIEFNVAKDFFSEVDNRKSGDVILHLCGPSIVTWVIAPVGKISKSFIEQECFDLLLFFAILLDLLFIIAHPHDQDSVSYPIRMIKTVYHTPSARSIQFIISHPYDHDIYHIPSI